MARTIPVAGEAFLGDDPGVMKVLKIVVGDSLADININDGDSEVNLATNLCSLPYGIHVYDVGWRVITAFNAAVDITLGVDCSSDCDYFAEDADIACSTTKGELVTTKSINMQICADSRGDEASATLRAGFEGFTPDSAGNNLVMHTWKSAVTAADSGVLEVYVYYHGAVTSDS